MLVTPFLSGAPPPKKNPGSAPEMGYFFQAHHFIPGPNSVCKPGSALISIHNRVVSIECRKTKPITYQLD